MPAVPPSRLAPAPVLLAAVLTVTACGSDGGARSQFLDLSTCIAGWRVVHSPRQELVSLGPEVLRWHDGELFMQNRGFTQAIVAIPPGGGSPRTVQEGAFAQFWVEGDRVLYVSYYSPSGGAVPTDYEPGLFSVPRAGGTPELILETDGPPILREGIIWDWAFDGEALYWLRRPYEGPRWTFWRRGLTGTADELLSELDDPDQALGLLDTLVLTPDRIMAFGRAPFQRHVVSVPRSGGPAAVLPLWDRGAVVGVSNDGAVFWQRSRDSFSGEIGSDTYEAGILRPGASAVEPFWSDKPPPVYPTGAWGDGQGGWYVGAFERAPGGAIHNTVWRVTAEGTGRRLGCDPEVQNFLAIAEPGPDRLYAIIDNPSFSYWQLVEVASPE